MGFDPQQLITWLLGVGITDEQVVRLLAVARAENSGLDAGLVVNEPNGTKSYGLWMINDVHLRPGEKLAGWSTADLLIPNKNADAALKLSNFGQDLSPWTTYKTGAYLLAVPWARGELATWRGKPGHGPDILSPNGIPDPATAIGNITGTSSTVDFLKALGQPGTWVRVMYVVVGGALLVVGVSVVSRPFTSQAVGAVGAVPGAGKLAGKLR